MAPPCRWIFARSVAARLCPIQYALHVCPSMGTDRGLKNPNRLEHLQHQSRVDGLHGHRAEDGVDVQVEYCPPLLSGPWIFPTWLVAGDEGSRALLERHRLR